MKKDTETAIRIRRLDRELRHLNDGLGFLRACLKGNPYREDAKTIKGNMREAMADREQARKELRKLTRKGGK